jgi:hypothetical protein
MTFVKDFSNSIFSYYHSLGWLWTNYEKLRISNLYDFIFRLHNVGDGNTRTPTEQKADRLVIDCRIRILVIRFHPRIYPKLKV